MKIAVIGTGYVGLVTGTCFAEIGHSVICMDNDSQKIQSLRNAIIPIWEPGLQEMVERNLAENRLSFSDDIKNTVIRSDVVFIAVGTPPGEDGSADLQYVLSVAKAIAENMNSDKIIVDKSTVPVGTGCLVHQVILDELRRRKVKFGFQVVSNPEFLKEGAAIEDFMKPDRVVIGTDDPAAETVMRQLYAPFNMSSDRIIIMTRRSAEMTKYAANAMLATKISFINEIALLCEKYDADVTEVRKGIGSDNRIGYHFIYPGVGYGGSCFPKDVKALIHMAEQAGLDSIILKSVEARNFMQKQVLVEKVFVRFGKDLTGLNIAVWGLSFKPKTDDMREAPSIVIINELVLAGANIKAYDPVATDMAELIFKDCSSISILKDQYEATENADALLLITEWPQFRAPDFVELRSRMKQSIVFDGRNQYEPHHMQLLGFEYFSIGR